jgi:uroporphyrinogen decarboxylase
MNKREKVLSLLDSTRPPSYIPAAFFLHFPPDCHSGQAAIDAHLEFCGYTGMDVVKIQYEFAFPRLAEIQSPDDWAKMPAYRRDFFQEQLDVVDGLVTATRGEMLVLQTLYSPFMSAGHTASSDVLDDHLKAAPEKVVPGLETITESILWFVRECIKLGVDGFYASTQGGEGFRFRDPSIFEAYVKPYDLAVMNEIDALGTFNILHVCDYCGPYDDLTPIQDYPGHVVNSPLEVGGKAITAAQAAEFWGRPYMGGMDRHGVLVDGTEDQIRAAALDLLKDAPERFFLGADCTVPGDINWDHLKAAIDTAHAYKR